MKRLNPKGFTLVEIIIVVSIVGLLAAIAIPNLLRARANASEGAMKSALRTFSSGNESYRAAQSVPSYAPDVDSLITSTPPYLDTTWTATTKYGFSLAYTPETAPASSYSMLASPTTGSGLSNYYCVDQNAVIMGGASGVTASSTGCSGGTAISG